MGKIVLSPEGPTQIDCRSLPGEGDSFRVVVGESVSEVSASRHYDGGFRIQLADGRSLRASVTIQGQKSWVTLDGHTYCVNEVDRTAQTEDGGSLEAPMPGKVLRVLVSVGDEVEQGDALLILEAMKMEHTIKAPHGGTVEAIAAQEGEMVNPGTTLVTLTS
jgi:3-methylcrotonyl-CoA carboxylase alpha subunit